MTIVHGSVCRSTSLALTASLLPTLSRSTLFFMRQMVSVERISLYTTLTQERPHVLPNDANLSKSSSSSPWPDRGAITFHEVCLKYRPNLPLVLKNLTVDIAPGHRIGVSPVRALCRLLSAAQLLTLLSTHFLWSY